MQSNRLIELYLDYANNFLTVQGFADHFGLNIVEANFIIDEGRELNNNKNSIMTYYNNQLARLNDDKEFSPTIVITDSDGNKTNAMNINLDSAKALISYLSSFLPRKIDFKRINLDINGNPRYVCHFLEFAQDYETALKLAKSLGGRKYNNKSYGGGIVFQSYNIQELEKEIINLSK